jgi:NAD(P)-dependent dehydrogenase (short-subunit alcohol dehydrogenase family)
MTQDTSRLDGRKAIVLGANQSAAAAVALAFAKAGADVAVTSTSGDPEEAFALRPLRRAIEAEGRRAIADIADLSNGSSVQIAVRQIAKQLGRIDIAVIACGESLDKPAARTSDADWSRAIGSNLGAYFYACRALAREFEANEPVDGVRGRIIALLSEPDAVNNAVLRAARAGAQALVEALASEWRETGVLLISISLSPETTAANAVDVALNFASGRR